MGFSDPTGLSRKGPIFLTPDLDAFPVGSDTESPSTPGSGDGKGSEWDAEPAEFDIQELNSYVGEFLNSNVLHPALELSAEAVRQAIYAAIEAGTETYEGIVTGIIKLFDLQTDLTVALGTGFTALTPAVGDEIATITFGLVKDRVLDGAVILAEAISDKGKEKLREIADIAISLTQLYLLGGTTTKTSRRGRFRENVKIERGDSGKGMEAHHIVPQGMNANQQGGRGVLAQICRGVLAKNSINIDDGHNGVFLPQSKNDPSGRQGHGSGHTYANLLSLTRGLVTAHMGGGGKQAVYASLDGFAKYYMNMSGGQ